MTDALASIPGVTLDADRLIALRPLATRPGRAPILSTQPGGSVTRRPGPGLEKAESRAYVAGDDTRHLDHAATARTGRLHIRKFHAERDRISLLIADFRAPMFWGLRRVFRSVAAAECLTLAGWRRVIDGGRVALLAITPGDPVIVPARGRTRGMLDVIGGLVEAHRQALRAIRDGNPATRPLDQALVPAERLMPSGAELLIASGFDVAGAGLAGRLDRLARRRHPRLLHICAADVGEMPAGRYPMRMEGQPVLQARLGRIAAPSAHWSGIAARAALNINASAPVEDMASRLLRDWPRVAA